MIADDFGAIARGSKAFNKIADALMDALTQVECEECGGDPSGYSACSLCGLQHASPPPPTPAELKLFVDVYDCAMGCYPTPGTEMWRVRQWLLSQAA